jgi:DNA-directed RNA polymerase specialized sigma24 family protein
LLPGAAARVALTGPRHHVHHQRYVVGYRKYEIADKLALSVKTYKSRMMDMLGLQTRTALVRSALELGMLQKGEPTDDK